MTQFLITALGSYGDVHPMVGLGTALAARGHRVKIITNPYFEDVVTGAGLELLPLGTRDEYIALSQHPDLWHPFRGPWLVLATTVNATRPIYHLVTQHYVPGETVLCAHVLDLGSRIAAEKVAAPIAGIDFAPGIMWSIHDSPRLRGMFTGPRIPIWLKRTQFWLSDTMILRFALDRELNGLRRELGLSAVTRVYGRWIHATDIILCLFPEWFGPPQSDWPTNTHIVGFPLWDAPGSVPISQQPRHDSGPGGQELGTDPLAPGTINTPGLAQDVRDFLATGTPPIAFSPGSANHEAHQFFEAAVDACQRLGRRGILLTKYDHQLPPHLPDTVRHFGFVPLSRLLRYTAALVHHGGIGTCAQGLAAGVPHIVRPMAFDQFDNSRRLVRLGVAEEISTRTFHGPTISEALRRLLASSSVAANCRTLAKRCDGPAARAAACDALEQLAEQHAARYK